MQRGWFEAGCREHAFYPADQVGLRELTGGHIHTHRDFVRCLEPAAPLVTVGTREISQPSEELDSPYLDGDVLDVRAWSHDALALAMPAKLLCRPDCAGLCPVCGVDLNSAGPEHHHERQPDPRWAKLSELRFE